MNLPPGFELESSGQGGVNLPPGFELDAPQDTQKKTYKASEIAGAAWDNIGKSAGDFYSGVASAVMHPIDTAMGLGDVVTGAVRNSLPKSVVSFIDGLDANPEAAQRASQAASAVGGMYKDRYGSYDAIKRTLAEDPVGAVADISTLLTGGSMAAAKVAPGVSKALATAAKVTNPLAPVAAGASVAKYGAKRLGNFYDAAANPKNALYMRAAEGRGPEIVNALRGASEIVKGSAPTAAQAAVDTGVVGFQKMGKSASRVPGAESAYAARAAQQAEAQLGTVRGVGKTAADISDAELQRANVTRPMYEKADATLSKVDSEFETLMQSPSMQTVMARAERLAADKRIPFKLDDGGVDSAFVANMVDANGAPMAATRPTFSQLPGTSIHFIKQSLDDMVKNPATFGIGAAEANAVKALRGEFLDWVGKQSKNPAYIEARDTYAKMSEPINQMKVGQYLEKKLVPALGEDTAALRSRGYAGALDEAPSTIKKATTGDSRFQTLEQVFKSDPDALKALQSVRDDLARQAKYERLAKGSVGFDVDVGKATQALAGETLLPNLINRITSVSNDIWRRLRGKINQDVAMDVAIEMLHPGKAADVLEKALKQSARRQMMGDALNAPFAAINKAPASMNMLAAQQEQQNALIGQ